MDIDYATIRMVTLLDMSVSMVSVYSAIAQTALTDWLTNMTGQHIEFGFDTFPENPLGSSDMCAVNTSIPFEPTLGTEAGIISWLASTGAPDGLGPLACGLDNFNSVTYSTNLPGAGIDSYLIVIVDGPDNCGITCTGGSVTDAELTTITAELLTNDIMTFAIGLGASYPASQLDAIAAAGGTGITTHLSATNSTELEGALDNIVKSTLKCIFDLPDPAAQSKPNLVNIYVDSTVIPRNDGCGSGEGWQWVGTAHTAIELCVDTCTGALVSLPPPVTATKGCPTQTI